MSEPRTPTRRAFARIVLVLLALAATGLAACGSDDRKGPEPKPVGTKTAEGAVFKLKPVPSVQKLVPDEIASKGEVANAIYNDAAPQMYLEHGKLVGIQPDFAQAVSEVMGIKFDNIPVGSFDSIIPGLQGGRYDVAFADFGVTAEREKVVDFVVQFDLGTAFAVKRGSGTKLDDAMDLCGLKLGTLTGSYFLDQARALSKRCTTAGKPAISIQAFPTQSAAVLAVTNNRTDMYASSSDQIAYVARQEGSGLEAGSFVYEPIPQGIGLPKGSELGPAIRAAMLELVSNGTYAKILARWGIETSGVPADRIVINPPVS